MKQAAVLQARGRNDIRFALIGDGKLKPGLQQRAAKDGLTNVQFLDPVGKARLAGLMAGRQFFGWRGRRATRWLYAGSVLLLLAYVGSRFVLEVLLQRLPAGA